VATKWLRLEAATEFVDIADIGSLGDITASARRLQTTTAMLKSPGRKLLHSSTSFSRLDS
jgi:hypothetical protein